jgi:transposase
MGNNSTVVGLDVHKENITIAVLRPGKDRPDPSVTVENQPSIIEKKVRELNRRHAPLEFVYEAGPGGFALYRQITQLGHPCAVIAPAWMPMKPGDRVKTDRKDAEKLSWYWRMRDLKEVRIPTPEEESVRDLLRVREDVLTNQLRARHRLMKFLLRQGRIYQGKKNWTQAHREWLRQQKFDLEYLTKTYQANFRILEEIDTHLADLDREVETLAQGVNYRTAVGYLKCLKGVNTLTAMTLLAESGDFRRFKNARSYMRYTGMVSWEDSSGGRVYRGGIIKAGNAHLRRVLVQGAWTYRLRSLGSPTLAKRRKGYPAEVIHLARKADERLHLKFQRMVDRNKRSQVAVVAIARELAGFVWAIGQMIPSAQ